MKNHLYKSIIRPSFEYPIAPISIMSKTNREKYQSFQNKCIRKIVKNTENKNDSIENLHNLLKLDPINISFKSRMEKIVTRLSETHIDLYDNFMEENNDNDPDHAWWKTQCKYITEDMPQPVYIHT